LARQTYQIQPQRQARLFLSVKDNQLQCSKEKVTMPMQSAKDQQQSEVDAIRLVSLCSPVFEEFSFGL